MSKVLMSKPKLVVYVDKKTGGLMSILKLAIMSTKMNKGINVETKTGHLCRQDWSKVDNIDRVGSITNLSSIKRHFSIHIFRNHLQK